jgi:cation transport protein ChaC
MALTPDLVARVHRVMEDSGPLAELVYHTEADYDAAVQETLVSHPPGEDLWVFAYGSLIWKPELEPIEQRIGTARGWHRSFCLRLIRWRGTREQPGLMMALDRGGQCTGVAYRLSGQTVVAQLAKLFRREMSVKPPTNMPRWIRVQTDQGPIRAVAFVVNQRGTGYAGRLTPETTADILSKACGHWGSCAEYLFNTVSHLEDRGIHDSRLWQLQELVAAKIQGRLC